MGKTKIDILRLTHCPRCGYDLEGLPREHVCPECEYAYDETMSLIGVWAADEEPKIFYLLVNALLAAIFTLIFLAMLLMGLWNRGIVGWIVLCFFGVPTIVMLACMGQAIRDYRLRLKGKPPDALVFTPSGYVVTRKGSGQWKSWDKVTGCRLRKLRKGRWKLQLRSSLRRIFWKAGMTFIISATPRQAAAIRSRIRWCIKEANK